MKNYVKYVFDLDDIIPPYAFDNALHYYNIYPWIKEGKCLARILRLKLGKIIKTEIVDIGTVDEPKLRVIIKSKIDLGDKELDECRSILKWSLKLDEDPRPFIEFCKKDPILNAALEHNQIGGRGKVYPTVLEAMIGSICAQNTIFKRLYAMMFNICAHFGKKNVIDDKDYYSFPVLSDFSSVTIEDLRKCKVGYRAKIIYNLLHELNKRQIDPEDLKRSPTDEAEKILLSLPGIGPYSSKIILSVGLKRNTAYHLDSYVKEIMFTFFFNGKKVSEGEILEYIARNWGDFASNVVGMLTTDTEIWAQKIGYKFKYKSGARG